MTKSATIKKLDPRNTHEKKICTDKVTTRETFRLTNYLREKLFEPKNTHKKKNWTNEIPTRKHCGPTKYPQEKFGSHDIPTNAGWYDDTIPTRPLRLELLISYC